MDGVSLYDELVSSWGNHFQEKFGELMKYKYGSDYQPTLTYGNVGDRAVDGVLSQNTAFAVYAPEVYSDAKVIKKMESDFANFLYQRSQGHWNTINKYVFVIKYNRFGMTPDVMGLVASLGQRFPTEMMTLEDLKLLTDSYLPFSDDGKMFEVFKSDFSTIGEYAVRTDFSAAPISISFPDELDIFIEKWSSVKYIFKNDKLEDIKKSVVNLLIELSGYMTDEYIHVNGNGDCLIFRSDNHDKLVEGMRPNTIRIRTELSSIMNIIYFDSSNIST